MDPDCRPPLTETQRARLDGAKRELDDARRANLGALDGASLVLLVERLRGRLDDTVTLVDELT